MEIFEKIGDAASKTYRYTAEKTSKFAKETKLKIKINELKQKISDIYREIGETVFEKYVVDEELDMAELKEKCEKIDELTDKIVECKNDILSLKEKKQCQNCYEEIDINAHYCPNCGFEQERTEKKSDINENKNKTNDEEKNIVEAEKVEEDDENQ